MEKNDSRAKDNVMVALLRTMNACKEMDLKCESCESLMDQWIVAPNKPNIYTVKLSKIIL